VVVIPNAIKRAPITPSSSEKSQSVPKSMTISESSNIRSQPSDRPSDSNPRLTRTRSAGSHGALAFRIMLVADRRVQVLQINDDIRDQSAFLAPRRVFEKMLLRVVYVLRQALYSSQAHRLRSCLSASLLQSRQQSTSTYPSLERSLSPGPPS